MAESQNIEYKEIWKDEYLKWLCGFANAQGGTLYVGVDDNGNVVGLHNINKMMEDLPNKIQSGLGIVADVNRLNRDGKDYLEIKVKGPSSFPINYRGEFYYRSGATNQKLTGIALTDFITRKNGTLWEDAIVNNITVDDLDEESFKIFRKESLRRKRMTEKELNVSNEELLQKLHLMRDGKLTRAAVLLFYKDPQIVQIGSYIKVGKFDSDGCVVYHHTLEESLIVNASKVVDLIYLMYLKAKISYEHDRRVEEYPFARLAIREAIFNAIAHNCYMYGTPIQIRISDEYLSIANRCILPENWTIDTFMTAHDSMPFNPNIANVFYRAGFIESWGQGINKICEECTAIGAEIPKYELVGTSLRLTFKALERAIIRDSKVSQTKNDTLDDTLETAEKRDSKVSQTRNDTLDDTLEHKIILLLQSNPSLTQQEIAEKIKVSSATIKREIKKLVEKGKIERSGGKRFGKWIILN